MKKIGHLKTHLTKGRLNVFKRLNIRSSAQLSVKCNNPNQRGAKPETFDQLRFQRMGRLRQKEGNCSVPWSPASFSRLFWTQGRDIWILPYL